MDCEPWQGDLSLPLSQRVNSQIGTQRTGMPYAAKADNWQAIRNPSGVSVLSVMGISAFDLRDAQAVRVRHRLCEFVIDPSDPSTARLPTGASTPGSDQQT